MFQNRGRDSERGVRVKEAIEQPAAARGLDCEPVIRPQMRGADRQIGVDFSYGEGEVDRKTIDKVPTISGKLVINMFDEANGSVEPNFLLPSDQDSQQVVEPDEVVDMGVRDKDVFQALNLSRRQVRYVAEGRA